MGLTNIHSRLKLLYGDHYGLKFYNERDMAVVMLSIPKEAPCGKRRFDMLRLMIVDDEQIIREALSK